MYANQADVTVTSQLCQSSCMAMLFKPSLNRGANGAVETRWTHEPKVGSSLPGGSTFFFFFFLIINFKSVLFTCMLEHIV